MLILKITMLGCLKFKKKFPVFLATNHFFWKLPIGKYNLIFKKQSRNNIKHLVTPRFNEGVVKTYGKHQTSIQSTVG